MWIFWSTPPNLKYSYRWIYHSIALNETNSMVQSVIENIKNWWRYSWFYIALNPILRYITHSTFNISINSSPILTGVRSLDLPHWDLYNSLFIDKNISNIHGDNAWIYAYVNKPIPSNPPISHGNLLMNRLLSRSWWDGSKEPAPVRIGLELVENDWMYMVQILLYILDYTLQPPISPPILVQLQPELVL